MATRERPKFDPNTSSTKRRPILMYRRDEVEVLGHVLRATGERCNDRNEVDERVKKPSKKGKAAEEIPDAEPV